MLWFDSTSRHRENSLKIVYSPRLSCAEFFLVPRSCHRLLYAFQGFLLMLCQASRCCRCWRRELWAWRAVWSNQNQRKKIWRKLPACLVFRWSENCGNCFQCCGPEPLALGWLAVDIICFSIMRSEYQRHFNFRNTILIQDQLNNLVQPSTDFP